MAVAGGRVFTVTDGSWAAGSNTDVIILSAFNESTGAKLWSEPLQNLGYQQWIPSALIASGGVLYLEGGGYGGTVYAVNQSTGKQTWTTNTLMSSPVTLARNVLVVAGECGLSSGLNAGSGAIEWTDNPGCSAGGSLTSSYDGTDVWVGDPADQGAGRVLNPATGAVCARLHRVLPHLWVRRGRPGAAHLGTATLRSAPLTPRRSPRDGRSSSQVTLATRSASRHCSPTATCS